MKSKVIRVCSLVLLSVAVSTALVSDVVLSQKRHCKHHLQRQLLKVMKSSAKQKSSEKKIC